MIFTPVKRDYPGCIPNYQLMKLQRLNQQQTEWWVTDDPTRERMSFLRSLSFIPHSLQTSQQGTAGVREDLKRGYFGNLDFPFLALVALSKRLYYTGRGSYVPTGGNFICWWLWLFCLDFGPTHFGPLGSSTSTLALQDPTPGQSIDPRMELSRQVATSALLRLLLSFFLSRTVSTTSYFPAAGQFFFFSQASISSKMVLLGGELTFNLLTFGDISQGSQEVGPGFFPTALINSSRQVIFLVLCLATDEADLSVMACTFSSLDLRASKYLLST